MTACWRKRSATIWTGSGNDRIYIDAGNDTIDGGNGSTGCGLVASCCTINLSKAGSQNTGYGSDTLSNIENIQGGSGHDVLAAMVCKHPERRGRP